MRHPHILILMSNIQYCTGALDNGRLPFTGSAIGSFASEAPRIMQAEVSDEIVSCIFFYSPLQCRLRFGRV